MKRLWKRHSLTQAQSDRRLQPVEIVDGCAVNGCIFMDDVAEETQEELQNSAVSINTIWEAGDMPIIKHDSDFAEWRQKRIEENRALTESRSLCLLPWEILKALPSDQKHSDRLYWSQGGLGSCMGHADSFAHHNSQLYQIARGAPLQYTSFNPICTWAVTKGGSTRGGQTVSEMAKGSNLLGHYPEYLVGTNNQQLPEGYTRYANDATSYQAALVFLKFSGEQLTDEIFKCCAAGISVAVGNSVAVNGSTIDKNGIKIATLGGRWAHATSFTAYRVVNGVEYVAWPNSHGPRYKSSDEGEPADLCWMTRHLVTLFMNGSSGYGAPYGIVAESKIYNDTSLYSRLSVPFPSKFRF